MRSPRASDRESAAGRARRLDPRRPGCRAMSAARTLWAGVDAGGSKTLAVVVDARGCEVGRGLAGGANYQSIGLERAVASLRGALDTALRAAGYALPLTAAWIGMAGRGLAPRPALPRAPLCPPSRAGRHAHQP